MQDLVDIVWDGARTGTFDSSPLEGRWSVDDGERAQLSVLSRWAEQGQARGGWKVGLTSGAVRDSFGPGVRPFGFILRDRIFSSGAAIDLGRMSRPGLETEMCFRAGRRLAGPDVEPDEVEAALDWAAPAFEINEARIDGPQDPGIRVADNLTQWGIVVGPAVSPLPDRSAFDKLVVTLSRDGAEIETVAAAGYIDDHYLSIARLAKELAKFDLAIEEGDLVITGSMARHKDGIPPGEWVGTFEGIGEVRATFAGGRP
jgi:2-keto-4-pentenoate hydratase